MIPVVWWETLINEETDSLFKGYCNNSSHGWSTYFMIDTAQCLPQILTTALQVGNSGSFEKGNLPRIIYLQVQELSFHARLIPIRILDFPKSIETRSQKHRNIEIHERLYWGPYCSKWEVRTKDRFLAHLPPEKGAANFFFIWGEGRSVSRDWARGVT